MIELSATRAKNILEVMDFLAYTKKEYKAVSRLSWLDEENLMIESSSSSITVPLEDGTLSYAKIVYKLNVEDGEFLLDLGDGKELGEFSFDFLFESYESVSNKWATIREAHLDKVSVSNESNIIVFPAPDYSDVIAHLPQDEQDAINDFLSDEVKDYDFEPSQALIDGARRYKDMVIQIPNLIPRDLLADHPDFQAPVPTGWDFESGDVALVELEEEFFKGLDGKPVVSAMIWKPKN